MTDELKTVSLNAPAAPLTEEIKSLAKRYLIALGQGAEKAEKDAERIGHDFIVAHYHAGTDPYEEERAAAKESATGSADTSAASTGTSTPAAPAAVPEGSVITPASEDTKMWREADRQLWTEIYDRMATLEEAFKAHVETNHLAAHPLPPAIVQPVALSDAEAQSLDAVEAEKKITADTLSPEQKEARETPHSRSEHTE